MKFHELGCLTLVTWLASVLPGSDCEREISAINFLERVAFHTENGDWTTYKNPDGFSEAFDAESCSSDVTSDEHVRHAFYKYISWTMKDHARRQTTFNPWWSRFQGKSTENELRSGCTCKEVVELYKLAKDTKPSHLMYELTGMFNVVCQGYVKGKDSLRRLELVLAAFKTAHSDVLKALFAGDPQFVRTYLAGTQVDDESWPLSFSLDQLKSAREAVQGKIDKALQERGQDPRDRWALESFKLLRIAHTGISISLLIDLELKPPTFKSLPKGGMEELILEEQNVVLRTLARIPNAVAHLKENIDRFPAFVNNLSLLFYRNRFLTETKENPQSFAKDVMDFMQMFFKLEEEKKNWNFENTSKALKALCGMALKTVEPKLASIYGGANAGNNMLNYAVDNGNALNCYLHSFTLLTRETLDEFIEKNKEIIVYKVTVEPTQSYLENLEFECL